MTNAIKKKITPKDFNPKKILGLSVETRTLRLGVLMGIATDVTTSTSPQGEVLEGLAGRFVFKPDAADEQPVAAYVLWLPSGMGTDLFELPREKKPVEFAFVMGVNRAENPAGYEWTMTPLVAPTENDPLAALAAKVGAEALAAPAAAPAALEAPKEPEPAKTPAKEKERAPA